MQHITLLEKVASKTDNVTKYIFKYHAALLELSYINKNDGKDIICVPCQSTCRLGCKFCHTTDSKNRDLPYIHFSQDALLEGIEHIIKDQKLHVVGQQNKTLLVSFMGCGEPLLSAHTIQNTMVALMGKVGPVAPIRFALATALPAYGWTRLAALTQFVAEYRIPLKLHLSMHYTTDETRKAWMPASMSLVPSLLLLQLYRQVTKNPTEVHYALIAGVNDTPEDVERLPELLQHVGANVKFMFYNTRDANSLPSAMDRFESFKERLDKAGIQSEYYIPPGLDVGSSCGQFLLESYQQYLSHSGGGDV